jgi:uncharacterized membrane protein
MGNNPDQTGSKKGKRGASGHPLDQLQSAAKKIVSIGENITKLSGTPEGIEMLKSWTSSKDDSSTKGKLSPKQKQIIKLLNENPNLEDIALDHIKIQIKYKS